MLRSISCNRESCGRHAWSRPRCFRDTSFPSSLFYCSPLYPFSLSLSRFLSSSSNLFYYSPLYPFSSYFVSYSTYLLYDSTVFFWINFLLSFIIIKLHSLIYCMFESRGRQNHTSFVKSAALAYSCLTSLTTKSELSRLSNFLSDEDVCTDRACANSREFPSSFSSVSLDHGSGDLWESLGMI